MPLQYFVSINFCFRYERFIWSKRWRVQPNSASVFLQMWRNTHISIYTYCTYSYAFWASIYGNKCIPCLQHPTFHYCGNFNSIWQFLLIFTVILISSFRVLPVPLASVSYFPKRWVNAINTFDVISLYFLTFAFPLRFFICFCSSFPTSNVNIDIGFINLWNFYWYESYCSW